MSKEAVEKKNLLDGNGLKYFWNIVQIRKASRSFRDEKETRHIYDTFSELKVEF